MSFFAAASLLTGASVVAFAQSSLPLRGSVDDTQKESASESDVPPVVSTPLRETQLEVAPIEEVQAPPRARRAEVDPYAPTGIGTGGLRLYPSLTVGAVYSSNAGQSAANPQSDTGLRLLPRLKLESDWVRHAYEARFDGDLVYYRDNGDFDSRTITASQRLRLDVRRTTTATLDSRYALDTPEDGGPEEQTLSGGVALGHDFGPASATLRGGLLSKSFGDTDLNGGGSQSNGDLDYVEPSVTLRTSLRMSDMLRPYVEASYAPRYHGDSPDRFGFNRDSDGIETGAGVQIAAGPIWEGEVGLTYLHRNYHDGALDSANALGLAGELTWSPSELTSVVMAARTSIDEVASNTDPGKPVYTFRADATHALRDNVDLSAGLGVEIEDLGNSIDRTYDASLGVAWKFNPVLSWSAGYDFTWLDSETKNGSYTEHRLTTGLTISR